MTIAALLRDRIRRAWLGPLAEPPRPLLDPDRGLMVVWAAKAACSASFVWFTNIIGCLEDLRRSGLSPHRYRQERYHGSDLYRRGRKKPISEYYVVHILRDPYSRAVSSYRQALRTGYADKRLAVSAVGPLDSRTGFSFSQFLDYLETIDLAHANIHHRLQLHPVEALNPPARVINVSTQDLYAELNRLERDLGLPGTDFAALQWLHRRESRRKAKTLPFVEGSAPDLPLAAQAAFGREPWPAYEQFLTVPIRRRIERLYAADFDAFAPHI